MGEVGSTPVEPPLEPRRVGWVQGLYEVMAEERDIDWGISINDFTWRGPRPRLCSLFPGRNEGSVQPRRVSWRFCGL